MDSICEPVWNCRIRTLINGTLLVGDDGCERLSLGPFETAVKTFTPAAAEEQVTRFQLTGNRTGE